jgi:hypothetical protein
MSGDVMAEEPAQTAFGAYREHVGRRAHDGTEIPAWEDIPEELLVRGGWRAAAKAVLDRHAAERDLMLGDLGDLLRAVGMFDGAQPRTPHDLMQAAIARVRQMTGPAEWAAGPDGVTGQLVDVWPGKLACQRCGEELTLVPIPAGQSFTIPAHACRPA